MDDMLFVNVNKRLKKNVISSLNVNLLFLEIKGKIMAIDQMC